MKLNNIRLLVKDFDTAFEFYADKVGLPVSWGKPGGDYASFDIGIGTNKMGLSIFKTDLMARALGNMDKKISVDSREKILIVVMVESVDETYQRLSGKGVEFVTKPADIPGWGSRVAHFRDTEDNIIEICSELPKEQWSNDLLNDAHEFENG